MTGISAQGHGGADPRRGRRGLVLRVRREPAGGGAGDGGQGAGRGRGRQHPREQRGHHDHQAVPAADRRGDPVHHQREPRVTVIVADLPPPGEPAGPDLGAAGVPARHGQDGQGQHHLHVRSARTRGGSQHVRHPLSCNM